MDLCIWAWNKATVHRVGQIQRKLFVEKSLQSKWWPVFSAKLVMWRLFHLSIVGRSIRSATRQFVCLKSSEKFENESLFQNVELVGHPPYSPDLAPNGFSLFPHIKKKMRGQRFSSDTVEVFQNQVLETSHWRFHWLGHVVRMDEDVGCWFGLHNNQ